MRGTIRHGKLLTFLFFLVALNTFIGNFWAVVEIGQDMAAIIESSDFDLFRIFRGGRPTDPSHFGDF